MSAYFTKPDALARFVLARAVDINTRMDAVETGFDNVFVAIEGMGTAVAASEAAALAAAAAAEASAASIEGDATAAAVSAAAAAASASSASTSASTASTAATNAQTAETNAETAETNAETAATTATNAVTYAAEWANKAEDSLVSVAAGGDNVDDYSALHHAAKAADSASAASTSAGTATTQAGIATTAAGNAATAETNAETAETNAETAASLAAEWAEKVEDSAVTGYPGQYSALHHAAKAAASAAAAATFTPANYVEIAGDTMTGALGIIAGSVGTPGLFVSGDTNTGVYASAADTLDFAAGGVRGFQVNTASTAVNYAYVTPSATSADVTIGAAGSDADIDLAVTAKGAGVVRANRFFADRFGAYETLASATTPALGSTTSQFVNITGTTQIDGFSGGGAGTVRFVRFAGALTLNYGVSLDLPGAADIVTAAGDEAIFVCASNGTDWKCISYTKYSGGPPADIIKAPAAFRTEEYDNGNSGTSITLYLSAHQRHKLTLTGNLATLTFNSPQAGCTYLIKIVQGAGPYTITWPSINWKGGAAPTLSTGSGDVDFVALYYDGSAYWGEHAADWAAP